jgi:hypothetical protein
VSTLTKTALVGFAERILKRGKENELEDMMIPIAIYESDFYDSSGSVVYNCDLKPDRWYGGQHLVTPEEYTELVRLLSERERLQNLLRKISSRKRI